MIEYIILLGLMVYGMYLIIRIIEDTREYRKSTKKIRDIRKEMFGIIMNSSLTNIEKVERLDKLIKLLYEIMGGNRNE